LPVPVDDCLHELDANENKIIADTDGMIVLIKLMSLIFWVTKSGANIKIFLFRSAFIELNNFVARLKFMAY